jgi:hypothetical protein
VPVAHFLKLKLKNGSTVLVDNFYSGEVGVKKTVQERFNHEKHEIHEMNSSQ